MTSHYLQLFARQQTDLLLLPPCCCCLISGAITGAWYWILTKLRLFIISRSRTENLPHSDLVVFGISIHASPNLDIFGVKFDSKLTFEDRVWYCFSCLSENLRLVKHVLVDTCYFVCYYAFVLLFLEHCPPVWGSATECHLQLLRTRCIWWSGFALISVSCSCVIDVMLL